MFLESLHTKELIAIDTIKVIRAAKTQVDNTPYYLIEMDLCGKENYIFYKTQNVADRDMLYSLLISKLNVERFKC